MMVDGLRDSERRMRPRPCGHLMRTENDGSCSIIRTAATIFILAVVWIGYTAWPIYDLLVLVRAIETRDVHTVTRHVYFDAVRASLTNQIVAAYVQHTGIQIGPLAQSCVRGAAISVRTCCRIGGREFCNIKRCKSGRPDLWCQARNDGGWVSANSYMESGCDIQRMSGIAGNTQPRPATT